MSEASGIYYRVISHGSSSSHVGVRGGNGQLCSSPPDAVPVLLGDAAVFHPVRHGGDGRRRAVLHRSLLVDVSRGDRRDELGHCDGGVRLHRPGMI